VKADNARGGKPVETLASRNGLFDDDDEDLFAPATSKPSAANKKGLSQSEWLVLPHQGANYKKILRLSYDVIITYDNRKSNLR